MSLLTPLALLGAAIAGPIIIAMYLLKLRRDERRVSSTFLWKRMVRDVEANAPWQRLRTNWLLLLQLILMALLVIALARPFFYAPGIAGTNLILIIDRSASMGATENDTTRLDLAKQQATQLIDQLPDGGRATIIAAGGAMDVLASATTDRRELRSAIQSITLQLGGGSDMSQALTLASALAARDTGSEVVLISDGNVTLPEGLTVPATVRYFPIGEQRENVALSAIALQPAPGGQTLFVQLTNYGDISVTRRVDVHLDGALFNAYHMTIEPGREQSIIADVPATVEIAEAMLSGEDAFPLDDHVWAVSSANETTTVRIVGPGNRFLETGLSLLPGVEVTTVPTATTTFAETAAQIPVTIFDGYIPPNLPDGNLFFIAPPRSTDFFSVTGILEFPNVRPMPGDEPLLRNVSLSDVNILQASRIIPGLWARVVVDSNETPLLVAGEQSGRRIAVLAFDLHASDLPLQVAFPLLLSNIIGFLSPGSGIDATQIPPGQPLALPVDPAITDVRLIRPDGTQLSSTTNGLFDTVPALTIIDGQLLYPDINDLGIYTVEMWRGENLESRSRYAVNLFAPNESRVTPQPQLAIAQTSGLQSAVPPERVGRQEFWRWIVALALLVLMIEWFVYQRQSVAYLWRMFLRARKSTS